MRKKNQIQMPLMPPGLEHPRAKELGQISEILDAKLKLFGGEQVPPISPSACNRPLWSTTPSWPEWISQTIAPSPMVVISSLGVTN